MSTKRKRVWFTACASSSAILVAFTLLGCLDEQTPRISVQSNECTACHGDASRPGNKVTKAAPPFDLNGNSQSSARGVGAHQAHLTESESHVAVACNECHTVPDSLYSSGHLESPDHAKVIFGALAASNGSQPIYDPATASCSNTYCHQAYSASNSPNWILPKSSADACGSCHGLPPAAPHPQSEQCSQCHGAVVDNNRKFVNKALHIDGRVETGDLTCNSCHGTARDGGPPPDLEGNVDTSAPGVGAHQIHLAASATHAAVACTTCHVVPTTVNSPGHIDGTRPADLSFSGLAQNATSNPVYDAATHTCSGAYCHGSAVPVWNSPRSSEDACGSCHGLPPPAPHPQKSDCSSCHSAVIGANRQFVNPSLHVDGTVQVSPSCNSCHGTSSDGSPPPDLSGNTDPSVPGVGAHQRHLQASATHGAVACNECHQVPSAWDSPGHDVTAAPPAIITFGELAKQGGGNPAYLASNHTCTNTYCHASATPNWVAQRTPSNTCGTCHAVPPPFVANVPISSNSHPKVADCSKCHGAVIDANLQFVAPDKHINGTLDVDLQCNSCHGSSASPAPPTDLSGNTSVTSMGVGAHQRHVTGGAVSRPVPCNECHIVPAAVNDPGHIEDWSTAEVTFGGAAVFANRMPVWNRQTGTCTDSWCHGPSAPGSVSPVWNDPNVQLGCVNCHGLPPPAPHPALTQCGLCHTNVRPDWSFIDRTKHINGSVDF